MVALQTCPVIYRYLSGVPREHSVAQANRYFRVLPISMRDRENNTAEEMPRHGLQHTITLGRPVIEYKASSGTQKGVPAPHPSRITGNVCGTSTNAFESDWARAPGDAAWRVTVWHQMSTVHIMSIADECRKDEKMTNGSFIDEPVWFIRGDKRPRKSNIRMEEFFNGSAVILKKKFWDLFKQHPED